VFSTTLAGLKAVVDTSVGNEGRGNLAPTRPTSLKSGGQVTTFIRPNLLVPELKRLLPIATVLASLSGQKLDATLIRHLTENLFPLESIGPISADVWFGEDDVDVEVRIVLEGNR